MFSGTDHTDIVSTDRENGTYAGHGRPRKVKEQKAMVCMEALKICFDIERLNIDNFI